MLSFALRMLRRDARAGELRLLVAALVLAVAALSAVGFFTDRVSQALAREANQLLGADLLLRADHPWPEQTVADATALGLRVAHTRVFPSMVMSGPGRVQLAEVKAVSERYPLRGSLRIAATMNAPDAPAAGVPSPGTIWLDERLLSALAAQVGDVVQLGTSHLIVSAVLRQEPDRGLNFIGLAPRLMMNLADLAATGLEQPGSRVTYRLLLAGEAKPLALFRAAAEKKLGRGERIEDAENARPEIRSALDRAQKFLGLAAMLTVVLAAVAVALASRRYMQRHLDPCAVMRCLGARQVQLMGLFIGEFVLLGLAAGVVNGNTLSAANAYSSSMFYIITYVVTTLGTFGLIMLMARAGFEADEIADLAGLHRRSPTLAAVMGIFMFSLAGVPPMVGFYAKLAVLQALVSTNDTVHLLLALFAVVMSLIGAFYYLRVVKVMYFDEPKDTSPIVTPTGARAVLSLNGAAVLLLGVLPGSLMAMCAQAIVKALAT